MKLKNAIIVTVIILCGLIGYNQTNMLSASVNRGMHNEFEKVYTVQQFDSICKADSLPNNLNKWRKSQLIDAETFQPITEYMFIKSILPTQKIYRVDVIDNEHYKVTKRITK